MKLLLVSALLPALLLMRWVYRQDTIEQEPRSLLRKLVLLGALSCIPAGILESLFIPVMSRFAPEGSIENSFLQTFLVIGVAEEGCKYYMLRRATWHDPNFNYRFDGIVYAVFVSLGFAALENVSYLLNFGPGVLVARGLLSVPGHCTFGIFMGLYYANSKQADIYNSGVGHRRNQWMALIVPVLLHGFYDFCLMSQSETLAGLFIVFVIIMDIVAIRVVHWQAKNDRGL